MYTKLIQFEWDSVKAADNKIKHAVTFEAAITIWDDPDFLDIYDASHSQMEDRFIRIGLSDIGVLTVIYTERKNHIHRIISARRASQKERKLYYETQKTNRL